MRKTQGVQNTQRFRVFSTLYVRSVKALGFVSARHYAARLAVFLGDPDVNGQVLDTLIKMKTPGYAHEVSLLLHSDKTWIRRLAEKYLDRY
jgi:hypothetical protein